MGWVVSASLGCTCQLLGDVGIELLGLGNVRPES